jgi:metallo-beta-lactamase family protein
LGTETDKLNSNWGFEPREINCLVLSHAHIDHSGLIPKLVKDGFAGKIYATAPTIDLCRILLEDAAGIQTNGKREETDSDVSYAMDDVLATMELFVAIDYQSAFEIAEGIELMFTDTGHCRVVLPFI